MYDERRDNLTIIINACSTRFSITLSSALKLSVLTSLLIAVGATQREEEARKFQIWFSAQPQLSHGYRFHLGPHRN